MSTIAIGARDARRRDTVRRLVVLLLAPVLIVAGFLAFAPVPAHAAGNGQLDIRITAINGTTGQPITSTGWGQNNNQVVYQVDYSCSGEPCENTSVKLDPTQLDPNLNYYRLLVRTGFNPPATPATITGTDAAGWTVNLGTLEAGQSGQFSVVYSFASAPGNHVSYRDGEYNGWAVANFPPGFDIRMRATISSSTAVAPVSVRDAGVIYQIASPTPGVTVGGIPGRVETDTDYSYNVYMASGCTHAAYNAVWGRVVASNNSLCAASYEVTHQLPPGVQFVSATGSPTVSGDIATGLILTWKSGAWTARNNAEPGWQSLSGESPASTPRRVTVRFPRENFDPADRACNYDATSGTWKTSVAVTYISLPGTPGEVKTASHTTGTTTVSCVEPYAKAIADPKLSTFDGAVRPVATESLVRVPTTGVNEKQWTVTVGNQANVDGVAVVTDNSLNLADAPVYRIETSLAGATVQWTATNGSSTLSGTSTAPVDAPAGYRFATAVVTSPKLTGPNQYPTQTARSNFTVTYKYRVSPSAPVGQRRTNTASAVMTYPDYPQLNSVTLTVPSHTIVFTQPFAKGDAVKGASGALTSGEYRQTIPLTGTTNHTFYVDVNNRSNVPATPIIDEADLRAPGGVPITQITTQYHNGSAWAGHPATIEYQLDNGVTGTATTTAAAPTFTAPAGRSFISARIVGNPIEGRNPVSTRNDATIFRATFTYPTTAANATPDAVWTNRATTQLTFPGYPELTTITNQVSATARLIAATPPATVFTATVGRAALPGGATTAGPATDVTFTVGGSTANVAASRNITPQYVFVAPAGWTINQGSASFPAGAVPAGVRFEYRTVTIAGVQRQAVVASWPAGTFFGKNTNLPAMSVVTRPGPGLAAGSVSRPDAYIGNTAAALANDSFTTPFTDAPDLDADGNVTERFATANNANAGTTIARQPAMQLLKEICLPDASAADGCEWIADSANRVGVPPNTTSIRYRLTVTNSGNVDLSDVVGYDVLPYPGDTGTSDATGSTPRGSTIREVVSGVSNVSSGLQLSYSNADQPCRPEVDATVPGCIDDWDTSASGAQAIRLSRPGTLSPGQSLSMQYTAAVTGNPGDSAVGCNSLAVRATGLAAVSEPAAVCAAIQETDLRITAGTPQLQRGRPGVLPYTVTNLGGAQSTQGRVDVAIPAGVTATSFTFGGWTCTAVDANGAPLFGSAPGPATLTCRPDQPLLLNQPRTLNVPIVPSVATFASSAEVTGRVFDGDLANNDASLSATAAPAATGLSVTKTDGLSTARPGDVLTYSITVHNTLLFETLTSATVTDTLPRGTEFVSATGGGTLSGSTVTWSLGSIPGDGTRVVTVTVRVLSTVFTDDLTNTANATAPDPANTALSLTGSASDVDAVVTRPELTLAKSSTAGTFTAVGDVITYTFSAQNTGDVTMHIVSIADPMPGLSALAYTWPGQTGILAPGQTVTATATYTVTQADLDATQIPNSATVRGLAPDNDEHTDQDQHDVVGTAEPSITLDKIASGTVDSAGDEVTYSFVVANSGPLTLQDVVLTDGMPGLGALTIEWPGAVGQLAPGQTARGTATYVATQADVDAGRIVNTASVTAESLAGVAVRHEDTETVPIERSPIVTIDKTGVFHGDSAAAAAGDLVEYEFTVANDGNTTLRDLVVTDPLRGLSAVEVTWPAADGVLLPGQTAHATATYRLTQADVDAGVLTNTATVAGEGPDGVAVSDDDSHVIEYSSVPEIVLEKDAAAAVDGAGDVVTYTFTVTNTGLLTLRGVDVIDPMPGLSNVEFGDWPGAAGVLQPGESVEATATYAATQADVDAGRIVNTATVQSQTLLDVPVTDDATETVDITRDSGLSLTKEGAFTGGASARAGDAIAYTFTVANTGNTTVTGVAVSDPIPGLSAIAYEWPGAAGVLLPGESVTARATYPLTQADVDAGEVVNTATATGTSPSGEVADEASEIVRFTSTPTIVLDKTAEGVVDSAGDQVTYTFTVTNDGPLTLTDVSVDDRMPRLSAIAYGTWPGEPGTLAPGQSVTATASYVATQGDVDAGEIVNTATATGTAPSGETVSDDDSETVSIERSPALTFDKDGGYGEGQAGRAGEDLVYEFTATNTGNTTLTDVAIDDPLPGLSALEYTWPGEPGVLQPGQSVTATARYVITQQDVDGLGGVTNTATVTTSAPDGSTPTARDTVTLPTPADVDIQLEKSATVRAEGAPRAGDVVEYRFATTNPGLLTLSNVLVADPMPGLSAIEYDWPGAAGVLAPGQTVIATAMYTLTQADVDAGSVVNTASVTGTAPGDQTVADEDTETTVLAAAPELALRKTGSVAAAGVWEAGDLVTFAFTVQNTGNVTQTGIAIDDPMAGLSALDYVWPGEPGVLAPGETLTATATYRLTSADASRRQLTNEAGVSSVMLDGPSASVTLDGPEPPAAVWPPVRAAGEFLAYTGGSLGGASAVLVVLLLGGGFFLLLVARRRRRDREEA